MDCRITLDKNETFLQQLERLFHAGEKVFLLIDDNGITRAEGLIRSIHLKTTIPYMELDNGFNIAVKDIIALNGVFLAEYGEC